MTVARTKRFTPRALLVAGAGIALASVSLNGCGRSPVDGPADAGAMGGGSAGGGSAGGGAAGGGYVGPVGNLLGPVCQFGYLPSGECVDAGLGGDH